MWAVSSKDKFEGRNSCADRSTEAGNRALNMIREVLPEGSPSQTASHSISEGETIINGLLVPVALHAEEKV